MSRASGSGGNGWPQAAGRARSRFARRSGCSETKVLVTLEDLAQRRCDQPALALAAVAEHVADEVDRAALPGAVEDLGDRALQPLVVVGAGELDTGEAPGSQRAQELDPEALRLDLADVDSDHLPAAGVVDGVGDDESLASEVAAISDPQVLGIEPRGRDSCPPGEGCGRPRRSHRGRGRAPRRRGHRSSARPHRSPGPAPRHRVWAATGSRSGA